MRVAVISDIHGNFHALEAVLAELEREQPDALWCLGDIVGYGPRPNRCCAAVAVRADRCLAGNHDLGVLGDLSLEEFSPDAAESARWTREVLEPQAREFLNGNDPAERSDEPRAELFHASPRDPVWEYVLTGEAAVAALELTSAPLVLIGHTHIPLAILLGDSGRLEGGLAPAGTEVDLPAGRWLLNPGSVGQPRDGDPRAAFLLIDFSAGRGTFHRVSYEIERTQAEIRARELPESLAERLAHGA
jgi:predicted phosphodiesterase